MIFKCIRFPTLNLFHSFIRSVIFTEIYDLVEPVNKSMSSLKSLILSSQQFPKPPPKQYIPEWQLKPIAAEKKPKKITDVKSNTDTPKEVKFETTEDEISKPEVTEESLNGLQS